MTQVTVTFDYPDETAERHGVRDIAETLAARLDEVYPGPGGDVLPLGLSGGPALVVAAATPSENRVYRVEPDGLREMPGDVLAFAYELADRAADAIVEGFGTSTGCYPGPTDGGLLGAAAALVPARLRAALDHAAEVVAANGEPT